MRRRGKEGSYGYFNSFLHANLSLMFDSFTKVVSVFDSSLINVIDISVL